MTLLRHPFLFFLFAFFVFLGMNTLLAQKPKLLVTTDIGQDPDDQQSLVRLLHYANTFDLVGLIANADSNYDHEPPKVRTDILYEVIEAYEEIFPNLYQVDNDFPSAAKLKNVVKQGCSGNGRDIPVEQYIGAGKSTEGSQWIIQQVDLAKEEVNLAVWGGACDLAQALYDVRNSRTPQETKAFVERLRVYFIGKQDSSNQWIIDNFPEIWLILGLSFDGNSWNSSYRGIFLGGDLQLTSGDWLNQHVIGKQALSSLYPPKAWTMGGTKNPYGAMKEGDTPSFLFFLNNGLNIPAHPEWGGWGGRFQKVRPHFYRDATDTYYDVSVDTFVTNAKATVFRWRADFQKDFAARVQWGRGQPETINHYPTIKLNGNEVTSPMLINAAPGETINLDASASYDVDQDEITYEWLLYPEAGTYSNVEQVVLQETNNPQVALKLPPNGQGTLHLLLKVTDQATFPLVTYQRILVHVQPPPDLPLLILDTDMGSDCDDAGALAILHHYLNQGKATLLSCIYSSGKVPFGAGMIDAINTYYGRPDIPIGAIHDFDFGDPVDKMDAEKLAQDTVAFGHDIILNQEVPEATLLNRQLLAAQEDSSVTYVTIGHTKALYDLLQSKPDSISELSGLALVRKKVKKWVALGGLKANNLEGNGSKDWNFFRNGTQPYTDYLLEHFPCPAYFINAGSEVLTGQSLINAPSGTIVRTIYRDWLWRTLQKTLPDGRPSWDLAAVAFAVEGPSNFFETPEPGLLHFDINNGSRWEKQPGGTHYYVNQKQGIAAAFAQYLNSLLVKD